MDNNTFRGFTLHQIEIFLTVAKHLNFSKAARELYISQPAISSWIMKMEDALGVKVFKRKNRGVELTPEGMELYTKLEHVYQRFRVSVNMVMRDIIKSPKFNVGCFNAFDIVRLTDEIVSQFHRQNPQVDVYYEKFNYHELRERLICKELDVIFTPYYDVKDQRALRSKIVGSMPHYFFFPKSWSPDGRDIASILNNKPMILEICNGEEHFLDICRRYGFQPPSIKYVNSYLQMTKAIAEGDYFTIGGRDLAKDSHFMPVLRFLPSEGFEEPVAATWYVKNDNPWLEPFVSLLEPADEANPIKQPSYI